MAEALAGGNAEQRPEHPAPSKSGTAGRDKTSQDGI